jgi:hypothetical protein
MMKYAVLPSEIVDSSIPDQNTYEKQRAELWRAFCSAVLAVPDHAQRLQLALDLLQAILDEPQLKAEILLSLLESVSDRPRAEA